jgi:hypothetical protein
MHDPLSRFGEALVALPVELASRRRHDRPVEVHYVKSSHDAPGLPGGSICVVSGDAKATFLRQVREAASGGDAGAVAKVLHLHEEHLSRRGSELGEHRADRGTPTGEALAKVPAITEVSYRGKPVAEGMIVHPELDAMRVLLPYAGGRIDPSGFVASTYAHGKQVPDVDTVVVVREPELTPIERKVLDKLPEEVNQLVIGDPSIVANWGLAAAGAVFVVVVVAGVLLAKYAQEQMQKKEAEKQKELERQIEMQGEAQQEQQVEGQQEHQAEGQQERQAEGQQEHQAEGQQERQAEGQQEHQAEGQGEGQQEHQANSGNLKWFVDEAALVGELEDLVAGAAVQTLVQLRTSLMIQGQLR